MLPGLQQIMNPLIRVAKMKFLNRGVLLVFLALRVLSANAQAGSSTFDPVYGYDPLLYNGRVYSFFPNPGTSGTQFITPEFDTRGKIVLRGVLYTNLTLNYDIYNQQLVLNYNNKLGSASLIEISTAWLEKFELNGMQFEILNTADTSKQIYQVIGSGRYSIRYYHFKELIPDTRVSSRSLIFAGEEREKYVFNGKDMIKYKNNKSFVSAFDIAQQELIRKYLRKQKIKVKRAGDSRMAEMITYCNSISGL